MYKKFFGFKEKPFKLVPNPEYLFLSKSHEEALAHLSYAISHGDGFVEIIGEVGTGKTTLCRVFLENLDKSIEAAYIFNPKLDALQLLKVINDEFGIDSTPDNTKDLIDRLNGFLIELKGMGRKAIVLIDEAQNLSHEVLEQLRLLSNLETTREKLLQIILVGQPELGDMLASYQLRQLGQRITINSQLTPLSFQETKDYIRHRIALASHRAGPPFENGALKAIYEYSRGIPRLINIACDRALLNAFSRSSFKITSAIAREAIGELNQPRTKVTTGSLKPGSYLFPIAAALTLIGVMLYFYFSNNYSNTAASRNFALSDTTEVKMEPTPVDQIQPPVTSITKGPAPPAASLNGINDDPTPSSESNPGENSAASELAAATNIDDSSQNSSSSSIQPVTAATVENDAGFSEQDEAAKSFWQFLQNLNARHSRNTAILQVLNLWQPRSSINSDAEIIENDQVFFKKAAEDNGLLVQPVATEKELRILQTLNLPAVLTFYLPNHAWPKYLTLAGLDDEYAYFKAGDQGGITVVDRKTLLKFWSGEANVVWKNFIELDGIISQYSGAWSIKSLKLLLRDLSYPVNLNSNTYDETTTQIIKNIQRENGLEVDGIVGPFTKIVLYNEVNEFVKPSLGKFRVSQTENDS